MQYSISIFLILKYYNVLLIQLIYIKSILLISLYIVTFSFIVFDNLIILISINNDI